MITEKEALKLLKSLADKKNIRHCIGVSEVAFELATKIKQKNPLLKVDPLKVKIAALLHDIGKSKDGVHELNTVKILKNERLDDIADISMHGFLYEIFSFEGKNADKFLPKNLENKIVVLADMYYNQNGKRVDLEERFADIEKRYKNDKAFLGATHLAKPRMEQLEHEINSLI